MVYLQVESLTKSYGDRLLFGDISLTVERGEKVGLVARNGAGKTTLMRILAGEEDYDSGTITTRSGLKIGYLSQQPWFDDHKTLLENVVADDAGVLVREDYYDRDERRDKAVALLHKLKVDNFEALSGQCSGGQLKRAAIVRLIVSEPDMLLLDEPTNHLDIEMVEWLENYLATQKTTLLMVTHDRYFLDRVCNRILEIDRQTLFSYSGNYDYYLEKRRERLEREGAELAKVKNLLRTELEWMRRQPQARGGKARYRIDNFYDLQARSRVRYEDRDAAPDVKSSYIGSKIFEAEHVSKAFGDKVILRDWTYVFARGDKIGIVGDNGVGKTTFVKMLLGREAPDAGTIEVGQTVRWGYYSQQGEVEFDRRKRVIDAVREIAEEVDIDDKTRLTAPQFLNRFLFTVPDQQKYIHSLSGGELRRLNLAVTLMRSPNFLIFDEPTNDLDLPTLAVLEEYLLGFRGCVIVVSHDRFFLDRIANHLFVFRGDGVVEDFPGNYSQLRASDRLKSAGQAAQAKAAAKVTVASKPPRTPRQRKGLSYAQKREKEQIEQRLPELEQEKITLERQMSSGTLKNEQLMEAAARIAEVMKLIDDDEMRLLELMEIEEG